ncbi:DNA-formamidopyrimidine glycosylase family protein [Mucilaginibacter aquariorum]|uniref:Formamidopyrimidine-DNA glycosylase n=1 Tax=Mucilaginibacter aquariorum TaxID=2967225 RepID=A0ABT1SYD8_9SPHI|nr:DNA-formamidopyrimidine glycosylase family protein [Mucilaginibacter aquariorum]MCQ6957081.1 formamidopyrimidine-DNA glycosylase [Mucilaginibacter aquariorum]
MAELPDLTVFANILSRMFKNKVLEKLDVTVPKKLNVKVQELQSALEGCILESVERAGKTLQFHFSGENVLGLHLMLRGELVELSEDKTPKFQIMAFHFEKGKGFAVIDMLKQATATLHPLKAAAPDALEITKEDFTALVAKKHTIIKTLLMDQKSLRGIGNSYADEILYHACVSPFSTASAIPQWDVDKIFKSIDIVLNTAIKEIALANGNELAGELKDFMKIHNAALKVTSNGDVIKRDKIGGRTTYYTQAQQLFL